MAALTDARGRTTAPVPRLAASRVTISRVIEHRALQYRRTFRASLFSSFGIPVLFLTAMGLGLGGYVDQNPDPSLAGLTYIQFLAPGLLAATVMQAGSFEAAFPILGGLQWNKIFHAMFATPIRALDIVLGNLAWIALRLTMISVAFSIIVVAFGASRSPLIVLAIPAAVLTGLAFTDHGLHGHPADSRPVRGNVPLRDYAPVPVQRHVLPDREPAVIPPAGRMDLAAVARRRPVPEPDARDHRPGSVRCARPRGGPLRNHRGWWYRRSADVPGPARQGLTG
jgi:hypothetical protein